jgi:hypothetical protein
LALALRARTRLAMTMRRCGKPASRSFAPKADHGAARRGVQGFACSRW